MNGVRGYQTYTANQRTAASPARVLVMAYDTMVRHLRAAEAAMAADDFSAQNSSIQKVQQILSVLQAGLDPSASPDLCRNISALYDWFYLRLTEANIRQDTAILAGVRSEIESLRETWQTAERQSRAEPPAVGAFAGEEAA